MPMTFYEYKRLFMFPLLPVLPNLVRNELKQLIGRQNDNGHRIEILDVGGRKSPYTIGLNANITLLDIPQENATQEKLNLGFTEDILSSMKSSRSNIKDLIIEDMTKSTLQDESYDAVVSVEVIEHVEEDDIFVKNISKVLKKGGWAYFTTPNGDFIKNEGPNKNPDHKRHYTREQLSNLLNKYFENCEVYYAVKTGKYRVWGLKSFDLKKPFLILRSIFGNSVNRWQSKNVSNSKKHTAHLIAIAYK